MEERTPYSTAANIGKLIGTPRDVGTPLVGTAGKDGTHLLGTESYMGTAT